MSAALLNLTALVLAEADSRGWCCQDCGDECVPGHRFHWHHRVRETKRFNVGWKQTSGMATERLESELAKCDLLCARCHRARHKSGTLAATPLPRGGVVRLNGQNVPEQAERMEADA